MPKATNYFENVSGLNLSDSPFFVKDGQATGGWNFEYTKTGAVTKSRDRAKVNTSADAQTNCLGVGVLNTALGTKTVIRAAGTKLQSFDVDSAVFTNLSEDTAVSNSTFLSATSTQPVVFSNFNTSTADTIWAAGGGMAGVYGYVVATPYPAVLTLQGVTYTSLLTDGTGTSITVAYTSGASAGSEVVTVVSRAISVQIASGTSTVTQVVNAVNASTAARALLSASNTSAAVCTTVGATNLANPTRTSAVTLNGVAAPIGKITAAVSGAAGAWVATGAYYWSVALRKRCTQALSNASMDVTATIANATDTAVLTLPSGSDATKYDAWYLYRSAVAGATGFTTGTLVAKIDIATTSFTDTGAISVATSQNVPRAGSTVTDNSPLPLGTIKCLTAFKRRLIAVIGSTAYFSDLDKPESWPINNYVVIPTGGEIRACSSIGFNAPITGNTDEYLALFKEAELWVVTGDSSASWILKFVDRVGCVSQSLIVTANGFLAWVDHRGVYLWSGSGKPIYCSKPIDALFGLDGDIDDVNLYRGWGTFFRNQNSIIWYLSHRTKGTNKFILRLDLRLTLPQVNNGLSGLVMDGVFAQGYTASSTLAGIAYYTSSREENMLIGDDSGFMYKMFTTYTASGLGIDFQYTTKYLDMGNPLIAKQFLKVIVWVDKLASANLTLQYWADYRTLAADASQTIETIAPQGATASVYDAAQWDVAQWDAYTPERQPIVFNINGSENNGQGDCIKLNFLQQDINVPVTIYGFTVMWDEIGVRK